MNVLATIIGAATMLVCLTQMTQSVYAADVIVNIENMRQGGKVYVRMQNHDQFMSDKSIMAMIKESKTNGKITYTFQDVPKGDYAISIWHDDNDSGKMETKIFGIPKDGYAMSKNPSGPPSFKKASFNVADENVSLDVKMRYSRRNVK